MGLVKDFKDFAMRGNVLDLAVAVIIGAAFGKIISSFVKDVLMPPIGKFMGGMDFGQLHYALDGMKYDTLDAAREAGAAAIAYGSFIQTIVDFLIVAFVIFMVIKAYENSKKKEEAAPEAPPEPSKEEVLLTEIRDALRARN
ncbi:MAG: large-conductance mechanosensitive channel protein MscL [Chitinophagales bacterium]|nr:large-conductance mechanosensitive channel protein MscL [Chitinophagales bacterium]